MSVAKTNIENNPNRRRVLKGAGAGLAIAATTSTSVTAALFDEAPIDTPARITAPKELCNQLHYSKSLQLSKQLHDEGLDDMSKNLAIRTANCPQCGTLISAQVPYTAEAA